MFISLLLVVVLIFVVFLFSRRLMNNFFWLFYKISHKRDLSIKLMVILFLPGTIVHELSHFLVATFVGVHAGRINLIPKVKDGGEVIAGETQIAQCDPIRYSLIGIAPFLIGLAMVYLVGDKLLFGHISHDRLFLEISHFFVNFNIYKLIGMFGLFWVANTMFSSKKDLELVAIPLALLYVLAFVLYFGGIKLQFPAKLFAVFDQFLQQLAWYLSFVIVIDLIVLVLVKTLRSLIR